jgi:hypothetical protein
MFLAMFLASGGKLTESFWPDCQYATQLLNDISSSVAFRKHNNNIINAIHEKIGLFRK